MAGLQQTEGHSQSQHGRLIAHEMTGTWTDLLALVNAAIPRPIAQLLACPPTDPLLLARLVKAANLIRLALAAAALSRLAAAEARQRLLNQAWRTRSVVARLLQKRAHNVVSTETEGETLESRETNSAAMGVVGAR